MKHPEIAGEKDIATCQKFGLLASQIVLANSLDLYDALFYVQGKDAARKDCVLVKCKEDPRTFFFDAEQVR